jgi:endonuclease G
LVCSLEYLTEVDFVSDHPRINYRFFQAPFVYEYFQANYSDYTKSGYSRGHNVCASNYRSNKDFEKETYILLNISPQTPELNNGLWNELEIYIRKKAKELKGLYIITGPLYIPKTVTKNNKTYLKLEYELIGKGVPVPTHYFKIIYSSEANFKESYIIPNEDIDKKISFKNTNVFQAKERNAI